MALHYYYNLRIWLFHVKWLFIIITTLEYGCFIVALHYYYNLRIWLFHFKWLVIIITTLEYGCFMLKEHETLQ